MPDAGVVVMEIAGNAPAARLGFINPGDIIESVNKAQVTSVRGLVKQVENSEREMLIRLKRGSATRECYYRAPRSFSCRG